MQFTCSEHDKHSLFYIVHKACTPHMESKGESIETKSMKFDLKIAKSNGGLGTVCV